LKQAFLRIDYWRWCLIIQTWCYVRRKEEEEEEEGVERVIVIG
jgi:hypothetical protein